MILSLVAFPSVKYVHRHPNATVRRDFKNMSVLRNKAWIFPVIALVCVAAVYFNTKQKLNNIPSPSIQKGRHLTQVGSDSGSLELKNTSLKVDDSQNRGEIAAPSVMNASSFLALKKNQCLDGHIKGLPPLCGLAGCLQILDPPPGINDDIINDLVINRDTFRQQIDNISGWMDLVHYDLVRDLTKMQRGYDIVGSVGEIGVYHGRHATVLALNTDTKAGEQFFICEIFDKKELYLHNSGADRAIVFQNLEATGFTIDSEDPTKRLHIWADSSTYLTKEVFKTMGLPAFRFFSVDGSHFDAVVFHEIITVLCIIRDGGIISFDDAYSRQSPGVNKALRDFTKVFGDNLVWPLIYSANKMYATTKSYYSTYIAYIEEHLASRYKLKKCQDAMFGAPHVYYTAGHCYSN